MAHNTLCSAITKANNFIAKPNSNAQQEKRQKEFDNPKARIACSKCKKSNITLLKINREKYICMGCKILQDIEKQENKRLKKMKKGLDKVVDNITEEEISKLLEEYKNEEKDKEKCLLKKN